MQQLFLHQAILDSVEVNESFILQSVDQRMDYVLQNLGSKEKMEEYFRMNSSQIREMYYEMEYNNFMMNSMKRSIVGDIKVSPALVRRYYNSLPQDSIPFVQSQVEVQIITLEPEIEISEIERVKSELRDYTERVNNNETSFSTLALLYSEDPGSARRGGELDFVARAELDPEFANVAFNLTDPKAVSKIVETGFGFHIIQLIEKRGDMVNCRHILLKPRVTTEALQQSINDLDSISAEIARGLYTFDECVSFVSYDKDTRNNYGLLYDKDQRISKFEMKDLPAEVARAVAGLKVGEISKPFIMVDSKGREVVAIVKLKSRTNGHRATMVDDYQELQDVVISKLREEKIENWIREKQKTTYIHINEEWKNCEFKYPGWIK